MAEVHLHNTISTSAPSSPDFEERGHRPDQSVCSTTSGGRTSISNSQLLGNSPRPITEDASSHPQLRYSYTPQERKSTYRTHIRALRTRIHVRFGLRAAVLCWVVYCTIRYLIAVQIYTEDHVRSRYALGMGIASAFTIVFFACETYITLCSPNNQFYQRLRNIIHSLAYLSSALVLGLTILNLILVSVWRMPHDPSQFGRSIQGRCHWDLDVVWSGTGMTCNRGDEISFGDWLSGAIARSVISAVLIIAYHLTEHVNSVNSDAPQTSVDADMRELADRQPASSLPSMQPLLLISHIPDIPSVPVVVTPSEDELQRRSLSFTAAGQVLSRIEGSELDDDGNASSTSSSSEHHQRLDGLINPRRSRRGTSVPLLRSESPEALSPTEKHGTPLDSDMSSSPLPRPDSSPDPYAGLRELASNQPPSSYIRSITAPSNDLQDFASAFRNLVVRATQEQPGSLSPDDSTTSPPSTVRVLGTYISRMSTIDSMASREAGSPVLRRPSTADTTHSGSNGFGARNLSMDPTVSTRVREKDEFLTGSSPLSAGSEDGWF